MQNLAIQIAHDSMSEVLHNQKQYNRYPKRHREVNNFLNRHAFSPNAYSTHPSNLPGKTSSPVLRDAALSYSFLLKIAFRKNEATWIRTNGASNGFCVRHGAYHRFSEIGRMDVVETGGLVRHLRMKDGTEVHFGCGGSSRRWLESSSRCKSGLFLRPIRYIVMKSP